MEIDTELLLKSFVAETGEGLAQMESALLDLESHPGDLELVNTVFRVVHTFKGNAAILEFAHALDFAHALEDLLDRVRNREVLLSHQIIDFLLEALDVLRDLTARASRGKEVSSQASKRLLQKLQDRRSEARPSRKGRKGKKDALAPEQEKVSAPERGTRTSFEHDGSRTLRVDVKKLDRLLDLTGEIAIARGRTTRLLEHRNEVAIDELVEAHAAEAALQTELQELVMKARMVPVGPLFRQYLRTVRDLARELGKSASLHVEGEDIEVDTSVVEHLRDPLLHMIRNAVDHGIESPEMRKKAGKPPEGRITLRASHNSGGISVEVEDDGAGLDREKILDAARNRGVTLPAVALDDQQVYQLVFESGVSTAEHVSTISGRGVGMDVVRRNVQALRGSISITSQAGQGTTIHLRFPLTLAIIEGFAADVEGNTYVIPLDHVVECLDLPAEEYGNKSGSGVINVRGEPLPYLDLAHHFGLPSSTNERRSVVVVRNESTRAGLVVDTLHGETQTVIKPLGKFFEDLRWAAGSSILGNGRVALILDVSNLLQPFSSTSLAKSACE